MKLEKIQFHLESYKEKDQILDVAEFLVRQFGLEHENLKGFDFREEINPKSILLTAEGIPGQLQTVKIPKNLFDFDFALVMNMLMHEMIHVRQNAQETLVEDKNEREFQAYYEMVFHEQFPQIPELEDFYKKQFSEKALVYYGRMGEGSDLQKKYAEKRNQLEKILFPSENENV